MKRIYVKAFNQLKKMGVPVLDRGDESFSINAEAEGADQWADYYNEDPAWEFGVNPKVGQVLSKCGLYAEWVNPGYLNVYPA